MQHDRAPAHFDRSLLEGPGADEERIAEIDAELRGAFDRLRGVGRAVSVFGSARTARDTREYEMATRACAELGAAGYSVITGGGPGTMEAANRGAREAGTCSIGLTIELPHEERVNEYVDLEVHFRHFFARKMMFVRYAQAFVVFPGGFGTLDELFDSLVLIQTGKVVRFPIILVDTGYWGGLLDWMHEQLLSSGRVSQGDVALLRSADDPGVIRETIDHLTADLPSPAPAPRALRQ